MEYLLDIVEQYITKSTRDYRIILYDPDWNMIGLPSIISIPDKETYNTILDNYMSVQFIDIESFIRKWAKELLDIDITPLLISIMDSAIDIQERYSFTIDENSATHINITYSLAEYDLTFFSGEYSDTTRRLFKPLLKDKTLITKLYELTKRNGK